MRRKERSRAVRSAAAYEPSAIVTRAEAEVLYEASETLARAFASLPPAPFASDIEGLRQALAAAATRLADNFPYHHPLYAGQMLKPPHPVARLAYTLAMELNPNNHALDGGRASSHMEREAVADLARLIGFKQHLGHLTSGGTIANLEALWVARELAGGGRVLASSEAHYTHSRMSAVLGMEFVPLGADRYGRMDCAALAAELGREKVACVVATVGTPSQGAVDPLDKIIPLARRAGARIHADAAYGGYFKLVCEGDRTRELAFSSLDRVDSVVIDPHKHGLQPYGCGAVLFRDPKVGQIYRHDSPYTYFTSDELHLGEISLECSRAGAAAVALWATLALLPLRSDGAFAKGLYDSLAAARLLHDWLKASTDFVALAPPMLDIVVYGVRAQDSNSASRRAEAVFAAAAARELHLALLRMPRPLASPWWPDLDWNTDEVTVLRSCLMKAEHLVWLPQIEARLGEAAAATR